MGWQRNYFALSTGERIRYSLLKRPDSDVYYVRFRGPKGGRPERSTGCVKKPDAIEASHQVISDEYDQTKEHSVSLPWGPARERLEEAMLADGKRPRTAKVYLETLSRLTDVFPNTKGPSDISDRLAKEFKTKYANGCFTKRRKIANGETALSYRRRPETLDSRLRMLKASFGWFKHLGLIESNPFENVPLPELDRHEVKYVRQADIGHFFEWLERRYPGWPMPRLFFSVKALTGCRLEDACSLRSTQLQDGRLVFAADQTKNRSERYAILPPNLFKALKVYRGKTYLWEQYPAELIAANKKKGYPTHRQKGEFAPQRLYLWVLQLMGYYQKDSGRDLSSHDFRRAAFTRAAERDIHPKRAAVAFDVTPETMLRYYTATEKKKTADEVLSELVPQLLPAMA